MHAQIAFFTADESLQEILIAELSIAGYDGFETKDDALYAFINNENFDQFLIEETSDKYNVRYEVKQLKDENWNTLWESNFQPVTVEDAIGIRAHFHPPFQDVQYEIIITPKMSFGTGHHATTFLMMQRMLRLDFTDKKVFDFGTGTGILAILSEKLGAKEVLATDNDEWCINNSLENAEQNTCKRIKIRKSDTAYMNDCFDIILANINKHILLEYIKDVSAQLITNGFILISGILLQDEQEMKEAAVMNELVHISTSAKDNWIMMLFKKASDAS